MAELYTMRPLFPGSSEADQLLKICKALGSPTKESWPEGHKLADQIGFKFPKCAPVNLKSIIQTASDSALDLMARIMLVNLEMMRYDPTKRPSAADCLQHPYFQVRLPIPLSVTNEEKEEEKGKPIDERPAKTDDEFSPQNSLPWGGEEMARPKRNKITSKELMNNARYKPGVKPLLLRGKN